jgi:hypothetical protein
MRATMTGTALTVIVAGRIAYRGPTGAEIGRERFELAHHAGGHVLRAFCEMDEIGLLRDVSLSLGLDWRPRDGFCRIIKHGETAASTWFEVGPSAVCVDGIVEPHGRISRSLPTQGPLAYLGLHPLQGDALIVALRGEDRPGVFVAVDGVTNSNSPNGDEDLGMVPVRIDVAFLGHEEIDVAAGRFAARHYQLRWHVDWPPADLWVRAEDAVFLLMRWSMIPNWYELVELEERL